MAKILNKDPATYQRERECFLRDLQQFHETRGTPFRKIPKINGHEIDLYLLYVLVTAHGGWVKVNSRNEWELLVENFCLPKHCVNSGVGLKQIYCRYLDRYEKVNYLGEDVERGSDDDEDSRHRRWSARALHSVPLTYNHHQHNVAENLRTYNGLSADLYKPTDYDRLALSLMSPLPNEQDFAINVCTLLSNEGKHTLRLDKYPRLVDFLLAHAGIYSYPGMREYFEDIYCNVRQHSLRSFWTDVIEDPALSDLIDESKFITKKEKDGSQLGNKKEVSGDDSTKSGAEKPGEKFPVYWADGSTKKDATDEIMGKIVLPGKADTKDEIMIDKSVSTEETNIICSKESDTNIVGSEKASELSTSTNSTSDKSSELPVIVEKSSTTQKTLKESVSNEVASCEESNKNDFEMKAVDQVFSRTSESSKNQEFSDNKDTDEEKSNGKSDSEVCRNQRTVVDENMEVDVETKEDCPVVLVEATSVCKCERTGVGSGDCAMETEYEEGEDGLLQKSAAKKSEKKVQLTILPEDRELFCLWRMLGTQDYVGQRVLQIATILRNLSFVEENVPVLGRNFAFLRFLLLCARSQWSSLHQVGLDMLGNVAQEIHVEDPATDRYSGWLVSSISRGVSSQDRFVVLSCLEVLNKLSQREDNEDIMLKCIDQKVYDQVCQFLTLHDIMLLIYTLECLYSLSSLGERACNCIARVHGAIDTLVSLITVEAQSYGPRACILMRVVETVSGVQSTATTTNTTTSAMAGVPPMPVVLPMTSQLRPSTPITPHRQTGSHKMVIGAPQPAVATPVSMATSHHTVPQQYFQQHHQQSQHLQQQHQHQQQQHQSQQQQQLQQQQQQQSQQQQFVHQQAVQENEQFALAWLRSAYEPHTGSRLEQGEVYKQYLTACAKVGRRGVIAPLHFPRCVRSVFGTNVGPIQQKPASSAGGSSGSSEQMLSFYEGIKVRANPFPIGVLQASGVAPATQSSASRKPFPIVQHMVTIPKTVTPPPMPPVVRTTPPPPPPPSSPAPSTTSTPTPTTTTMTNAPTASEPPTVSLVLDTSIPIVPAPASPILKAQLSAPPKPRDSSAKGDIKSQVLAHPHLTQALLGGGSQGQGAAPSKEGGACNNSTSLIKSLLATKVTPTGDSPPTSSSMMPASVCAGSNSSPQVTQRQQQQKLLQQQLQCHETCPTSPPPQAPPQPATSKPKAIVCIASKTVVDQRRVARMNGARTPIPVQAQLDPAKDANSTGAPSTVTSETVSVVVSDSHAVPCVVENHNSGSGGGSAVLKGRREPPQPPPPPLAPTSSGPPRLPTPAPDDSDSSRASSSRDCSGLNASTDDGENSLTSFEGFLLNGIPSSIDIDAASNDSSASKDSSRSGVLVGKTLQVGGKSLMLADLLEKKVEKKEPPVLNGIVGKELRIGEKGLELVENHLEKVLKESVNVSVTIETSTGEMIETTTGEVLKEMSEEGLIRLAGPISNNCGEKDNSAAYKTVGTATDENVSGDGVKCAAVQTQTQTMQAMKRPAEKSEGDVGVLDAKRPHLESATVNGTSSPIPVLSLPEDISKESDSSEPVSASTSAANLYAALAASTIEGEPDIEIEPTPQIQLAGRQTVFLGQGMDAAGQQLIVTAPRQIIVSQGQLTSQNQVLISAGGQLTLQQGGGTKIKTSASHQTMPMLVQTGSAPSQRAQITAVTPQGAQIVQAGQVVLTQSSSGQFILSQTPPNQVQLVTGTSQGSQYIVSGGTTTGQAHYVMAQPQTALVQGQSQTVLVAQTSQQQGTGTKTIIILQPQSSAATAAHHQKVMMTPQGQQVVVTQVPRPILQNPAPNLPPPALVPTSGASMVTANTSNVSTNIAQTPQKQQQTQVTSLPTKMLTSTISNTQQTRLPMPPANQIIVPAAVTSSATTSVIHQTPVIRPAGQAPAPTTPSLIQPRPPRPVTPTSTIRPPMSQPSVVARPAVAISSPQRVVKTYQNPRIAQGQSSGGTDKSITVQHSGSPQQLKTIRPSVSVAQQPQTRPQASGTSVDQAMFLCEWRGCMRSFASANEVYLHACEAHCPLGSEEIQCLWERCDAMRRKRLSLMTHLYDRHCNADVLRMMAVRRRQLSQSGRSEIPPPQPPPPHPGYAPNAAFHAIKRHALEFVNPKEMMKAASASIQARTGPSPPEQDDNEGPVTKSIRLTSSLILRNLVIYSTNGRRFLRSYEPHLASIALSNVESSRTIAQVLYDMNQQTSSQR